MLWVLCGQWKVTQAGITMRKTAGQQQRVTQHSDHTSSIYLNKVLVAKVWSTTEINVPRPYKQCYCFDWSECLKCSQETLNGHWWVLRCALKVESMLCSHSPSVRLAVSPIANNRPSVAGTTAGQCDHYRSPDLGKRWPMGQPDLFSSEKPS